jgi:hypothetical protein
LLDLRLDRRKFLSDALLFLQAADTDCVLVGRNFRDFDLLLQLKPQAGVRFYELIGRACHLTFALVKNFLVELSLEAPDTRRRKFGERELHAY